MQIRRVAVENFGSYERLEIEFPAKGPILVSGPTGAGKSTLCDTVPWVIFGTTAKNLAADEVRSWNSSLPTAGTVYLLVGSHESEIVRIRGVTNDLYYTDVSGNKIRGKDMADTQKMINYLLGMDANLYLSAAYFHEFSQTSQFFSTTAKNRRLITEQIADLSLSKRLNIRLSAVKKELSSFRSNCERDLVHLKETVNMRLQYVTSVTNDSATWIADRDARIDELESKSRNFDNDKQDRLLSIKRQHKNKQIELETEIEAYKLDLLPDSYFSDKTGILDRREAALPKGECTECGAPKDVHKQIIITKDRHSLQIQRTTNDQCKINIKTTENRLSKHMNRLSSLLSEEECKENTYAEYIARVKKEKNPHIKKYANESLKEAKGRLEDANIELADIALELSDVELLSKVNDEFRNQCLQSAINSLQVSTNNLLSKFFNGLLTVKFDVADNDKLEVLIMKDGNNASYQQLSKGQRAALKLCFGVSVMKTVSNHHGLSINIAMFDESLDGMSEELKLQAFRLFESMQEDYGSIFVIDHSLELKSYFNNRYEVEAVNGRSQITSI